MKTASRTQRLVAAQFRPRLAAAKAAKVSVSRWVAEGVRKSVETSWPQEFLALAGAFPDFPDAEELRKGYGEDIPGESL